MGSPTRIRRRESAPLYVPKDWTAAPKRDVALDLVRGLAMAILVVNHLHLQSPIEDVTSALVSAAEVLVLVSGVVAGMVFGRRWRSRGGRDTTLMLLRRARKLYVASLAVVCLVGLFTLVPGAATEALTITRGTDTYAFTGPADAVWSLLTLSAAPWQFNILGFFVVMIALTPLLLAALARGWTVPVAAGSLGLYLAGRGLDLSVLPTASERPFPLLIWQLLFVGGLLVGWHRAEIERALRGRGMVAAAAVVVLAGASAAVVFAAGSGFTAAHMDKDTLDPLRVLAMSSFAAALYLALRAAPSPLERLLLPLGQNSFYVFIVQVFVCLALASLPALAAPHVAVSAATQVAALGLLWWMASRGVLFRWIPR
jgi:hypothetical protein